MSFLESNQIQDEVGSMVKPFYADEYASIELDDTIPCVKVTLNGIPRYSEHYHLVQAKRIELVTREIKNYPKLHMLTDSRNAGPVIEDDVNFFKNVVLPEMERVGIRYLAIVMPKNKFTRLTVKEMTEKPAVMTIQLFDSMREARFWLRKMTLA
jgi:hypothetical protein